MRTIGNGSIHRYARTAGVVFGGDFSAKRIHDWRLITRDKADAVETPGYFNSLQMQVGDTILATLDIDGAPQLRMYMVIATQGSVTVDRLKA